MKARTNLGASVHQRLKNASEKSGRTFNDLAQYYALERWLYRLSKSRYAQNFILKGALMLVAWRAPVLRATRDIDLLARMSNNLDEVKAAVAEVCRTEVEEDGVVFDADTIVTERIAEDAEYEGVRANFRGLLATTRLSMQIDFGFSDVITPGPVDITYPTILDYPAPRLLAYNRETAVAEKFEAMISLGRLNSRMKDFFDIWLLANASDFEGADLQASVSATFRRRGTPFLEEPQVFTSEFVLDPTKQAQWTAFIKHMRPTEAPAKFSRAVATIREFLAPLHAATTKNISFPAKWKHPGPWA
jgi:predicted nucleotidyltransferase component of viral defense system